MTLPEEGPVGAENMIEFKQRLREIDWPQVQMEWLAQVRERVAKLESQIKLCASPNSIDQLERVILAWTEREERLEGQVDAHGSEVRERLGKIEEDIGSVNSLGDRVRGVGAQVQRTAERVAKLEDRVTGLELDEKYSAAHERITKLESTVMGPLGDRVQRLEEQLDEKDAAVRLRINGLETRGDLQRIAKLEKQVVFMNDEIVALQGKVG